MAAVCSGAAGTDTPDARRAQSHRLRCSDGDYHVFKFLKNPLTEQSDGNRFVDRLLRYAGIEPVSLNHFAVRAAKQKPMAQDDPQPCCNRDAGTQSGRSLAVASRRRPERAAWHRHASGRG
jgi:hypothetical protein